MDLATRAKVESFREWQMLLMHIKNNQGAVVFSTLKCKSLVKTVDSQGGLTMRSLAQETMQCYREVAEFYRCEGEGDKRRGQLFRLMQAAGLTPFFRDQVEGIYEEMMEIPAPREETESEREDITHTVRYFRSLAEEDAVRFQPHGGKEAWQDTFNDEHTIVAISHVISTTEKRVALGLTKSLCTQEFLDEYEIWLMLVWDAPGTPRPNDQNLPYPSRQHMIQGQWPGCMSVTRVKNLATFLCEIDGSKTVAMATFQISAQTPATPLFELPPHRDNDILRLLVLVKPITGVESTGEWQVCTDKTYCIRGALLRHPEAAQFVPCNGRYGKARSVWAGHPNLMFIVDNASCCVEGVVLMFDRPFLKYSCRALAGSAGEEANEAMYRLLTQLHSPGALARLYVDDATPHLKCAACDVKERLSSRKFLYCSACKVARYCSVPAALQCVAVCCSVFRVLT